VKEAHSTSHFLSLLSGGNQEILLQGLAALNQICLFACFASHLSLGHLSSLPVSCLALLQHRLSSYLIGSDGFCREFQERDAAVLGEGLKHPTRI